MIRTYIYGVPNGFDFYEKDAVVNDYFKGFYISSRHGRRFVVNRRNNGETIYSYIRYGLREVKRQPLHSFFGMSVVIENHQYCPNFKRLLGWFDYLFDKILSERKIFIIADDDAIQYQIGKFEENVADVDWIKSNLPNIFSDGGQTEILSYDSSFTNGKTGQVLNFNNPVTDKQILSAFKDYCWVSINSDIVEKEIVDEKINKTTPLIELDYGELNTILNEHSQQLLPVAIDISKGVVSDLEKMQKSISEISEKLSAFIPTIVDTEEQSNFVELEQKYYRLEENVKSLLAKMAEQITQNNSTSEMQYCYVCKQYKPLSSFVSPTSTKCIDCETKIINETKEKTLKCNACGKQKPLTEFKNPQIALCTSCKQRQENIQWIVILIAIALLCIILGVFLFSSGDSKQEVDAPAVPAIKNQTNVIGNQNNFVDENKFMDFLKKQDIDNAYKYLKGKSDEKIYQQNLKKAIEDILWDIIEAPNEGKDTKQYNLSIYKLEHKPIFDYVGFTDEEFAQWKENVVIDYLRMQEILGKSSISEQEYEIAVNILDKYSERYDNELKEILKTRIAPIQMTQDNRIAKSLTITYTGQDGKPKVESFILGERRDVKTLNIPQISGKVFVNISFPGGIIKVKKEGTRDKVQKNRLTIEAENNQIIYCGNLEITIRMATFKTA